MKHLKLLSVLLCALLIYNSNARANGADESRPVNMEEPSDDYAVTVNGKPVYVYKARVSKHPKNVEWPGHQRPLEQTEIAAFAYFDFHKGDVVSITPKAKVETYNVRPSQYGIESTLKGNTISFTVKKPSQLVVEVNGYHKALHLFVNPENITGKVINKGGAQPRVHYYGPGYHDAGIINIKSGETVYIDEGAVVYGCVRGVDVQDITITGKGILDGSKMERPEGWGGEGVPSIVKGAIIGLLRAKNVKVSGVILRDPAMWTFVPQNCENVEIDNVKLIGLWRYNADGIDLCNSSHVSVKNCFLRTFDDGVVIKGLDFACKDGYKVIEDINVKNCVLWCDWGRALEIGAETYADEVRNISFSNCYVVRFTHYAVDLQSWHHARVHDISYRNIYVEEPIKEGAFHGENPIDLKWMGGMICAEYAGRREWNYRREGLIDHISYKNIYYTGSDSTYLNFYGWDADHYVTDITLKNCRINGRKVAESDIRKQQFVERITIK